MRVIFQGDPNELEGMAKGLGLSRTSTTMYGQVFPMSAEVDVSHLPLNLQRKISTNAHFRVVGVDAEPVRSLLLPAAPAASAEAQSAESAAAVEDEVVAAPAQPKPKPRKA